MTVTVHGRTSSGVFDLLGDDEDSATFAVGWALDRSPVFRRAVLAAVGMPSRIESDATVALQRRDRDGGVTDIELQCGTEAHLIFEAKVGWQLPGRQQLQRYVDRFARSDGKWEALVTVSAMPTRIAERQGLIKCGPVHVKHLSWTDLRDLAARAHASTKRLEEKIWLREVQRHLGEFVAMDRRASNEVYVVALSRARIREGHGYTWIDVLEKDGQYFHPVGGGWPTDPPNYLGFRYGGQLRAIHHVEFVDIVPDLSKVNARWPKTKREHFVYRLGPAMVPAQTVRTGAIFRNGRVRCAIDTLLSGQYPTIAEARNASQQRLKA